jgi:hypothetical protein
MQLATLPLHIQTYGPLWYPVECFWYWFPLGLIVHGALFLAGFFVIGAVSLFRHGHFRQRFSRWAVFNLSFFVTAGLVNGIWSCSIFGRLYWSTDYVSDFSPFWPITQGILDARFGDQVGGLLGISLLQLQALWLVFAVCAWVLSYVLYRRYLSWRASRVLAKASNQSLERTAGRSVESL